MNTIFNRHTILDSWASHLPNRRDERRDSRAYPDRLRRGDLAEGCLAQSSRAEHDRDDPAAVAARRELAAVTRSRPVLQVEAAKGNRPATMADVGRDRAFQADSRRATLAEAAKAAA